MADQQSRSLLAIMFTDIVGYSAMMQRDENEGLQKALLYRQVLEQSVKKFNGETLRHFGDGSLSIFKSAVESLRCAQAMQLALSNDQKIPIRVGLHIGDIVLEGSDIYGDGVNIASRVETLGVAGSVLFTERLMYEIKNHPEFKFVGVGKYLFKNIDKPMELYASAADGLVIPDAKDMKGKGVPIPKPNKNALKSLKSKPFYITVLVAVVLIVLFSLRWSRKQNEKKWVAQTAIPEINKLSEKLIYGEPHLGVGPSAWDAWELAIKAKSIDPNNIELENLWGHFSKKINITSEPSGAQLFARPCSKIEGSWKFMGVTPLDSTLFPSGNITIKIEKEGYQMVEDLINVDGNQSNWQYTLPKIASIPPKMTLVTVFDNEIKIDSFLVDRFEVTNEEYKGFIASGGYQNPAYWKHTFVLNGSKIDFKEAILIMQDQTGRPGPSTWIAGDYPQNEENHPVSGISWYEAAAYCEFAHKQLPSVHHFESMIANGAIDEVSAFSNFNKEGPLAVGVTKVQNRWGLYDLFGNVEEWCFNDFGDSKKSILGGSWQDEPYIATFAENAKDPFDRNQSNGFRCIKLFDSINKYAEIFKKIDPGSRRNYYNEIPVSDEIFNIYLRQYAYDKVSLKSNVVYERDEDYWIRQKVELPNYDGQEKLILYVFLPKDANPPYQTIIFFPHLGAKLYESSEDQLLIKSHDFLVKNGRAVVFPIFKGIYERKYLISRPCSDYRVCDKEDKIVMVKDLQVTIDYLEQRADIDSQKLAYVGMSWGGTWGGLALAVENRLKLGILEMAGFWNFMPFPEVDPFNYHPRVEVPLLLLTGTLDPYFPYESSQKPFFEFLGTKSENKLWKTYQYGHSLPKTESIKEILDFLDKYFGPAEIHK